MERIVGLDLRILHVVLLLLRQLFLFLLDNVLHIGHQLETLLLFAVLYPHLLMIEVVAMIPGGLLAGIVVRAVICLTESILTGMWGKGGAVTRIEIGTEIATGIEISGTAIGTEKEAMIEKEIMTERETAGVIMIEAGILKERAAEGIETIMMITTLEGAGVEVGAKAGGLHLLFVQSVLIIIQALTVIKAKKKRERQHQAISPSSRTFMVI